MARRHLRRGSRLSEGQFSLAATARCRNSGTGTRVGLFFAAAAAESAQGAPYYAEPHKCARIARYPLTALPVPHRPQPPPLSRPLPVPGHATAAVAGTM